MVTLDNINLVIFIMVLFFSVIRFLKKALHLAFLLIPPALFAFYSNYNFLTTLAFWFVFTDFIFNIFSKITNLFNIIFLPKSSFSFSLIGKFNNCLVRVSSLFLIFKAYLLLFNSIISTEISAIITNSIICFISISIINIISTFLLKLHFVKTKKGTAI